MKLEAWLKKYTLELEKSGSSSPRLDGLLILEDVLKLDRSKLLSTPEKTLTHDQSLALEAHLSRRLSGMPMAYILGHKEFYGLNMQVSSDVLIPRPESESIVSYVIEHARQAAKVLELGTGSGCISVAISVNRPDLSILATDISFAALSIAEKNNLKHKTNLKLQQSDMFSAVGGKYGVIVANLPYISTTADLKTELKFEPEIALRSGEDGLDHYRVFMSQVKVYLKKDAWIIIEADPIQSDQLNVLAKDAGMRLEPINDFVYLIS